MKKKNTPVSNIGFYVEPQQPGDVYSIDLMELPIRSRLNRNIILMIDHASRMLWGETL